MTGTHASATGTIGHIIKRCVVLAVRLGNTTDVSGSSDKYLTTKSIRFEILSLLSHGKIAGVP